MHVCADLEHALNHQRRWDGLCLRQVGRNHQLGRLVVEGSGLQTRNLASFGELHFSFLRIFVGDGDFSMTL